VPSPLLVFSVVLISGRQIDHLLSTWGSWIVLTVVLAQASGVPVPGTTAVVAAALYAGSTHHLAIAAVVLAACAGAVLGYTLAFAVGRWGGLRVLARYGHRLRLTPARIEAGQRFFAAHGGKVVFFGRFVTGLRTWGGAIAGAGGMTWTRFLPLNVAGGVAWGAGNALGYFYFGDVITRASTGLQIGLAALGIAWIAGWIVVLHRRMGNVAETHRQRGAETFSTEGNSVGEG
jgi:membrane protein DedA with SNARE-associated domain